MARPSLYLASPYGFAPQWKEQLLPQFCEALESLGAEVWEPFERNNQIDLSKPGWAYQVACADVRDVEQADGFFAIVNGTPPDEGVMVELGVAFALGKPVFLFRDDFRRCTDSDHYPLNLMAFAGLPEQGWEAYMHASIASIGDSSKALAQWAQSHGG